MAQPKNLNGPSNDERNAANRLPPGQQLVAPGKWPVIGEREPATQPLQPELIVAGEVQNCRSFTLDQLRSLTQTKRTIDIHCVTRWSKFDAAFSGVLLSDLLEIVQPKQSAKFICFTANSTRDHATSLRLDEALAVETLIALDFEGTPLDVGHGGPIRNIVPRKYFYKSVKWLCKIELLEQDRLGFWEAEMGYHNGADPWLVQRYMAPTIDRRTAAKLIESKDFSGRDLRSIDASERELSGLNANKALLRDANFSGADLANADFTDANLSNAHFRGANLSGAKFIGTDLEGADLAGANLLGATLKDCSLIGASFCDADENGNVTSAAKIDASTKLSAEQLAPLTEPQRKFLLDCLSD